MTYFDPKKTRIGLQIKDPEKDYDVHLIHTVAAKGDLRAILRAWEAEEGCVAFTTAARGQNVFHICARFGHLDCLKALFDARLNETRNWARAAYDRALRESDSNKQRILHLAADHPPVVDFLLAKVFGRRGGSAINGLDYKLRTPLHRACLLGNMKSVKLLLSAGGEGAAKDKEGRTCLHLACQRGFMEVVQVLLAHQQVAEEAARQEEIKEVEDAKSDNKRGGGAARGGGGGGKQKSSFNSSGGGGGGYSDDDGDGDGDRVEDEGVAFKRWVNGKDDGNLTPLHLACRFGHNSVVNVLVDHGAVLNGSGNAQGQGGGGDVNDSVATDTVSLASSSERGKARYLSTGTIAPPPMPALTGRVADGIVAGRMPIKSPKKKPHGGAQPFSPKSPFSATSATFKRAGAVALATVSTPTTPFSPFSPYGGGSAGGEGGPDDDGGGVKNKNPPVTILRSPEAVALRKFTAKYQPMEEAVAGGHLSTVRLLRELGAGTSVLGFHVCSHKQTEAGALAEDLEKKAAKLKGGSKGRRKSPTADNNGANEPLSPLTANEPFSPSSSSTVGGGGAAIATSGQSMSDVAGRPDGVCEFCFFRQQWQSGHRSVEDGQGGSGGTTVVSTLGVPLELRNWRDTSMLQPTPEDKRPKPAEVKPLKIR